MLACLHYWHLLKLSSHANTTGYCRICLLRVHMPSTDLIMMPLQEKRFCNTACVCTAGQEHFYTTEGYEQGTNVLRIVGYFSLVGLLRVHTLVGDYHGALKALGVINPFQRSHLFTPKIASETPYPLVPPPECLLSLSHASDVFQPR